MIVTCKKEIPAHWIAFTILPWASFTLNFQVMSQAFVFSLRKFLENPAGLTFVLSLPSFLAILVAPVASFLSDRIWTRYGRRKPFVVTASALIIAAFVAMPLAPNLWALIGAYLLYHVGEALCAPRDPLKQEIVPPAARGRATGAMTWVQNLAQVVFFSVMLGRFDDVRYFGGIPIFGEQIIYWSAALLLVVMLLMIVLGIREIDQKSPLLGQRLSLRNFFGGILDRELWPVYLLVFSYYLVNIYIGFGPFLNTLLYTEQWSYTKQEMGTNVAIGGIVNLVLIGLLTVFANKLPRLRTFRLLIGLCLVWNCFYYVYVNLVLPDKRPTLVEIFVFGEVLTIFTILAGLVYTPLIYDYVRRNKMGTFAAGTQIASRATQLFTLNGVGLFIWAYASLFQPPAGEMTRVVLRADTTTAPLEARLRDDPNLAQDGRPAEITARVWQADGVESKSGRTWEIRRRDRDAERLAAEKKKQEEKFASVQADARRLRDEAVAARRRNDPAAAAAENRAAVRQAEAAGLLARVRAIEAELAARSRQFRAAVEAALGSDLVGEGDTLEKVSVAPAALLELPLADKPESEAVEAFTLALRAEQPAVIDARPIRTAERYGLVISTVAPLTAPETATLVTTARRVAAAHDVPLAPGDVLPLPSGRALTLRLRTVEQPVASYVSPVTRVVDALARFVGRDRAPARRLAATGRALRTAARLDHVRVQASADVRALDVTVVLPDQAVPPVPGDAFASPLVEQLGSANLVAPARAILEAIEQAAATQKITLTHPVLESGYVALRYDYMSGYLWVFFVGAIGVSLALFFTRLERRGVVTRKGVEEAEKS